MTEQRLVALTAMYIHKDIPININAIIAEYMAKDNRLNFK